MMRTIMRIVLAILIYPVAFATLETFTPSYFSKAVFHTSNFLLIRALILARTVRLRYIFRALGAWRGSIDGRRR